MATEVKVPSMGESITSGILTAWHVNDGDVVSEGQGLYELETDKITSEGQAECSGKITLKAKPEDEVEIGQVIAMIDETVKAPAAATAPAPELATSSVSSDVVSPAVRRIAGEMGIDPGTVKGTGKGGRVTKEDMLSTTKGKTLSTTPVPAPASARPAASSTPPSLPGERTSLKKMTPLRRKIAERLVAAQQNAAMLTTFNEVDMKSIMDLRKRYQDDFVKRNNVKLGFMSFFVKATVKALQSIPEVNAQIDDKYIVQNHFYDIGIAVGGPKGLMVPVVRDCDKLAFHEIELSIIDYAKKVREGGMAIEDLQGGVFTITNGGIYGSMLSTPILNLPQSAILGMHNIKERAVVINGEIVIRPMMYLALSYDHRIIDGKEAVTFLNSIKNALEDPTRLLFNI